MTGAEILIVEDDPELAEVLRLGFEQVSHSVAIARAGHDAGRTALLRGA
jgi:DNA-binding response OmpR family regulator